MLVTSAPTNSSQFIKGFIVRDPEPPPTHPTSQSMSGTTSTSKLLNSELSHRWSRQPTSCEKSFLETETICLLVWFALGGIHMRAIRFMLSTRPASKTKEISPWADLDQCLLWVSSTQTTSQACHSMKSKISSKAASPSPATETEAQADALDFWTLLRIVVKENSTPTAASWSSD